MIPKDIERFYLSSGQAGLEVHNKEYETRYWLLAGQAAIEIKEQDLVEMADLLRDFKKERLEHKNNTLKWASGLLLVLVAVAILWILTV